MEAVQNCTTPCEVLDIFSSTSPSERDLHSGIMKLWQIVSPHKKMKLSEEQLLSEHPNLHNLCYGIMVAAPTMSTVFLIRSLHVLVSLRVNQKARVMQTLLIVCQKRLGTLNEGNISLLANCLKMMESDRNVDVLVSGLRLLLVFKLKDIDTVSSLQSLMRSLGKDAPSQLKLQFMRKALQMVDQFSVSQCRYMFSILADIDLPAYGLLNACSLRLIDHVEELAYEDIKAILHCCFNLSYFNRKLLSALGDHVINTIDTWKIWQITMILKNLSKLNFRHVPLLDYLAEDVMQRSDSLTIQDLLKTIRVFSSVNHLPDGKADQFLEALEKSLMLHLDGMKHSHLLGIVYSFWLLGFLPQSAINRILMDESVLSTESERTMWNHIKTSWMLDTSQERASLPSLIKAPVMGATSIQRFHTYLQDYIGEPNLYQYSMQIPGSYYIDFVLAWDTEQKKLVPVDSLQTSDRSQNTVRIAVLCFPRSAFTLGSLHPNGNVAAKTRLIKSHGFDVVLIPVHRFFGMPDEEKVAFLRMNVFRESADSTHEVPAE
ncbi:LOW QUALITY PROTEIN: FAST kinase domain-containing protein 2, mitochondrial [Pseudophryne corroboree]|uniref:LOW QUALITY PROTEIN: FAST kinase domain-containing protein 2, mitochondrial n=1 Tax=Pseudophryne corroboree TaxID=495146 RepID=UPI003081D406